MAASGAVRSPAFHLLGILAGAMTMTQMVRTARWQSTGSDSGKSSNFIGGLVAGGLLLPPAGEQTLGGLATTAGLPFLLVFSGEPLPCSWLEHQLRHRQDSGSLLGPAAVFVPDSHESGHRYVFLTVFPFRCCSVRS
jgi:hypothetical protein